MEKIKNKKYVPGVYTIIYDNLKFEILSTGSGRRIWLSFVGDNKVMFRAAFGGYTSKNYPRGRDGRK